MEHCPTTVSIPNKVCYVDRCDRKFCYRAILLFLGHFFTWIDTSKLYKLSFKCYLL